MLARDIMDTWFHTINPGNTIADAVKSFQKASQAEKKSIFGLMVTDDNDKLVGMLSMYDILLFIQPKHAQIWGEMDDLDPDQLFDEQLEEDWLVDALRQMLARDVQRLFVHDGKPDNIIGVLSLSDAARFRSGTCRACMPSRVMTG